MNAVAGTFLYPPQNSNLQFDYSDTVVTSWVTNDSYPTEGVLTLWYWLLNGQSNWTITNLIEVVPANGSKSVALDIGPTSDFLGQFNINYNSQDGSQQKYTGALFNVIHHHGEISPETWNEQALSTASLRSQAQSTDMTKNTLATTSASTSIGTSKTSNSTPQLTTVYTDVSTTILATAPASTSPEATKTSNKNPHLATVIGLSVGMIFGIAALGLIGFLYWKKNKKNPGRRKSHDMSQMPAPLVSDGMMVGEMDTYQKRLELLGGRLDAELDGGRPIY